ncbi:MAG: hypothetical protein HYX94_03250 [Chloroflexi bacterium]|nr:hypothetical protein [Chloroflexota bacterium]
MDAWTYQGIELLPDEEPPKLFERICRLEEGLGAYVQFQAVGTFRAPMSKSQPPRYSPKGMVHRFLHVTWQQDSALAWSVLLHLAERDRRAVLSSFTGVGFLSKDVDWRDGHPRESVLLAAFTADAEDFSQPLSYWRGDGSSERSTKGQQEAQDAEREKRREAWQSSVKRSAARLRYEATDPGRLAAAARLAEEYGVRFEHGWYLSSGIWRSRYLVQSGDGFMALASPQESLCTCASRRPETLQLMMPSNSCVHHLAAKLVDQVAESAL